MKAVSNKELIKFVKNQKLLVLSTIDENGKPWSTNVYYSADKDLNLFFVSPPDTNHSKHIKNNSTVAFSIAWYDPKDLANRKAIQGTGACIRITKVSEIVRLLKNHSKYYPLWRSVITYKAMRQKLIESRPYIIKPKYMKFWNDELYGDEGTGEFEF
jgi:uncharacterized protein YhbP (UPF0306 family)